MGRTLGKGDAIHDEAPTVFDAGDMTSTTENDCCLSGPVVDHNLGRRNPRSRLDRHAFDLTAHLYSLPSDDIVEVREIQSLESIDEPLSIEFAIAFCFERFT